jgi:post-segregation antitoxin (ccd killing protein)
MNSPKPEKPGDARWFVENREAVLSINAFLETHGLLANKLRYRPREPMSDAEPIG